MLSGWRRMALALRWLNILLAAALTIQLASLGGSLWLAAASYVKAIPAACPAADSSGQLYPGWPVGSQPLASGWPMATAGGGWPAGPYRLGSAFAAGGYGG